MSFQPGKATNDPNSYIAYGKQSAKGTEASTFFFAKYLDGSGFEVEREVQREREGGDGQEVGLTYVSMVKADGQIPGAARAKKAARDFAYVLGQDSVAQGTSVVANGSLARHTLTPAASNPYLTVEQRWADTVERAVDCVFTGVTFEGEAGRPWRVTPQFIGGGTVFQRDTASALTVTRDTEKPHYYPFGSYIFDGAASYSGDFTKIKVEAQKQVDDGIQTTGLTRDDVVPLNQDYNVEGTLKFTSRAFYNKVVYKGGTGVVQDLATGAVVLTTLQQVTVASGVYATGMLKVELPLVEWTDAKVNKLDPDGKTVYLDVVGMSVKGGTHPMIVTVDTNDTTSYLA